MSPSELSYIINELGEERGEYFDAVAPPIVQTSNFVFRTVADMKRAFDDEYENFIYTKGRNPTIDILRKKLAALDKAEDCLVLNSGTSAIFASVFANVKSGDHIVSVNRPYSWAQRLFDNVLPKYGVATTYVDGRDIEAFERAILPSTKIIYLESPNSWDYAIQDLRAIAELARAEGIITICDNSYCTPLFQRPIELGIDMSLQSATKYIGGHSDVVAGVLTGTKEMMKKVFNQSQLSTGIGIPPFHAWLLLRGLRTLPARLERISATTTTLVNWLKQHPAVEQVIFPFDPSFPQYELAQRQMTGACGLVTIIIRAKKMEEIVIFSESLRHILMAVSWGGHESLVIPRCASLNPQDFDAANPEHRMLRFYFGLEDADYLKSDLEQAFEAMV
ncbi:PLP-dependent transferase [Pseudoflavitalea sp. G-6-1-2]|uniref:trans-sulfuration enzyme family protein n=1 Tax=Pseudoflavitalea sp. G-6-1-2 TaxID=2728841 RepID=UPI00146D1FC7|nr:PLP-dependent aspartate aminotransferase family protein [Pseudoflavitalea sp. G-6-1-2]NML19506.1 PLP-dependent transferase [Pseudoflavitalea sp. G-6-1-2]